MTITAQTSKTGPYSGNGTTTVFSYTFEVQDETHLVVTLADAAGVETVQVLNTDYTVSGVGNANGGQITMSTAPASGYTLTISRNIPITQEVDLENRRSVAPEVLEDAYDKLTQIAQDLSEQVGRAIKVSVTEGGNPTLSLQGDVQPNTFLGFDASGNLAQLAPASGTFISPNAALVQVDDFTGDGTTVDFTLGGIPLSPNNLFIFLDGVMQDAANYTVSGTTLTFTTAPPLNTNIEVRRLQAVAVSIGATTADLVTYDPAGSGAQQTTVQAKLRDFVSVKDFGAVGDGVTDNSSALFALRDYLITQDREKHWTICFPPGDYRYSNNRWLNGLLRVTIEAYGATLTCTQVGNFVGDGWPFGPREQMFRATGEQLVDDVGFAVDLGDRINTANIGDSTITLTTASDADNYAVGDRIFIFSYALGNTGYTPNFRYFEWAKITAKAGAVLTLGDLVQNPHLSNYPDFLYLSARTVDGTSFPDQYVGKPRIINLDGRPQTDGTEYWYPEQIHIKGARFPQNPNTSNSYRLALAGRKVLFEDVVVDPQVSGGITMGFDTRESEFTEALRCSADTIEIDKLLYHTEIDGCNFDDVGSTSLIGGTSSKTVVVKNSNGNGIVSAKALDAIIIEGNQFSSVGRSNVDNNGPYMPGFPGGAGAALAMVNGNTALMDTEQEPVGLNVLLITAVAPGVDATDGVITDTYNSSTFYTLTGITPGRLIWLASEPRVKGIVRDVILDGATLKVRFKSGNFPESIKSGYITGTPTYAWSANDKLYLDGALWNPKGRFEDVETGLLDWSKFYAAAGYDIEGVDLVGDGTGAITDQTGFSRIVNGNQTYRLTYDIATTSGDIRIRDGSSASNLATINGTATGATVDFTTSAGGRDVQFRPNSFNGTFTPIKLERL